MADEWYYVRQGEQQGPVSLQDLQGMLDRREMADDELVWTPGMERWEPAQSVSALRVPPAGFTPALPPLPPGNPSRYAGGEYGATGYGSSANNPAGYAPPPPPFTPLGYAGPGPAGTGRLDDSPFAGFGARFVAWIIDLILLLIVGGVAGAIFGGSGPREGLSFLNILIPWIYHALLESSAWGGTVGMRALGMRVTTLDGRRITFGRATGRHFASYLSALIIGIGYLMILWTERKQALHDILASCVLVKDGF